jgi:hypothetical protein
MKRRFLFMRLNLLALILLGASSAFAAELTIGCLDLAPHTRVRACLNSWVKRSLADLEKTEAIFRAGLASWRQEPERTQARLAFDSSVTEFLQYRTVECEFHAALGANEVAAQDRQLLCMIELNRQRNTLIKNQMSIFK